MSSPLDEQLTAMNTPAVAITIQLDFIMPFLVSMASEICSRGTIGPPPAVAAARFATL
jgi:hypothetical protein